MASMSSTGMPTTRATLDLINATGQIIKTPSLLIADKEHFTNELFEEKSKHHNFDLLAPAQNTRRTKNILQALEYERIKAGFAIAETNFNFDGQKTQHTLIAKRPGEKEYDYSSFSTTSNGMLTPKINHDEVPLLRASGGLFSNVQDLERLAKCLMNAGMLDGEQVIDNDIIQLMCQPYSKDFMASGSSYVVHANWPNNAYGYGIIMFNYGKHRFLMNAGGGNHATFFIYDTETRFSMIIHSNLAWQSLFDSFIKIFEVVLEQENPSNNDFDSNKKEWKEITGNYYRPAIRTNQFSTIKISERDEKLYINFNNSDDTELKQIGNLTYMYSSPYFRYPMAISFQRDESNQVAYLLNVWRAYLKNK